jgi:prevent-host-death family protein
MTKLEAVEAQQRFAEVLALVGEGQERVVIESDGQQVAAVISYTDLKRLEVLEDASYVLDFQRAVAESDGESYSVEEVIAHYNKLNNTDFTKENILND